MSKKTSFNNVFVLALLISLSGCAYMHDTRTYDVYPVLASEKAVQLGKLFEEKLTARGLKLVSKYHDSYPEDDFVAVFEIPRKPEDQRREPHLIISLKDSSHIQLTHSELWADNIIVKHRPEDYIKEVASELKLAAKEKLGLDIDFVLTHEYRAP